MKKALIAILAVVVIPLAIGISGCGDTYNVEHPQSKIETNLTDPDILVETFEEENQFEAVVTESVETVICYEIAMEEVPVSCFAETKRGASASEEECSGEDKLIYDDIICLRKEASKIFEDGDFVRESLDENKDTLSRLDLDVVEISVGEITSCDEFLELEPECLVVPNESLSNVNKRGTDGY